MSCECTSCGFTIAQPETIWYACTRYSPYTTYVCGTCLGLIPGSARHPVAEAEKFKISFGHLIADIGSHGRYQSYGSRQGDIKFWVEKEVIDRCFPENERFLEMLYPYYCPDEYLQNFSEKGNFADLLLARGKFLNHIERHRDAVDMLSRIGKSDEKYQEALYFMIKSYKALGEKQEEEECRKMVTSEKVLTWLRGEPYKEGNMIYPAW